MKQLFRRSTLILTLCLLMALPGLSQTVTFGGSSSGNNFGVGDVINILGAGRSNGPIIGGGGYGGGNSRNDKLQTAIQIAGVLYQISRSRNQNPTYPSTPYPSTPYPNNPYPNNPYPESYPEYPTTPSNSGGLLRPDGYDAISFSGRTIKLDPSILPLSVNPGDGRYQYEVESAVQTWNNAGLGQLFELTNGQADLTIDWSGSRVSSGARAETRMAYSRTAVVPTDLSVKVGGRSKDQLARIMTHELGHVLGLDHSDNPNDVMYRSEQYRTTGLSQRDRQMLHWIYSQNNYTPVVGRTDINQGGVVAGRLGTNFNGRGQAPAMDFTPQSVCSFHEH